MSDAQWDGYPPNPQKDGWHWLLWGGGLGFEPKPDYAGPLAYRWQGNGWWDGHIHRHARYWQQGWRYLGPCLTPAEVEARIAELEAALNKINKKDSYPNGSFGPFAEIARAVLEGKGNE